MFNVKKGTLLKHHEKKSIADNIQASSKCLSSHCLNYYSQVFSNYRGQIPSFLAQFQEVTKRKCNWTCKQVA